MQKTLHSHAVAEEHILRSAIDMVNVMAGESAWQLISKIPLSNNTISRRIHFIVENVDLQLIEKMKGKQIVLQVADGNKDAHLICYVRFWDINTIVEDCSVKALLIIRDKFVTENDFGW